MRSSGFQLLLLLLCTTQLPVGGGCGDDELPQGPAVETGFEGGSPQYVTRDDFLAGGHFLDSLGLVTDTSEVVVVLEDQVFDAELVYLYHSGSARNYTFGLGASRPGVPLTPGVDHLLRLRLTDPAEPTVEPQQLATTEVQLHPETLIIPVVVWNLAGAVPDLDEVAARLMLDRGAGLTFPDGLSLVSWGRQRPDEVWASCNVQFRLVGYREQWIAGECWQRPPVSNQDPFFQKCVTNRPACTAGDPTVQNFADCNQQEVNRCTLRELLDWTQANPGYGGPALHASGAVNVYLAEGFHLWENMTAGIGCTGGVPFVALSNVFGDSSGLRLPHELGHVMGIVEHIPDTVMGDSNQRTTVVPDGVCTEVRAYVMQHYPWVQ